MSAHVNICLLNLFFSRYFTGIKKISVFFSHFKSDLFIKHKYCNVLNTNFEVTHWKWGDDTYTSNLQQTLFHLSSCTLYFFCPTLTKDVFSSFKVLLVMQGEMMGHWMKPEEQRKPNHSLPHSERSISHSTVQKYLTVLLYELWIQVNCWFCGASPALLNCKKINCILSLAGKFPCIVAGVWWGITVQTAFIYAHKARLLQ